MLNKLLGNLKNSLPESLRNKMGASEDSQGEQSEEYSEESSKESHDTSANDQPAAEKTKKQRSMIIRVVIILGIAYYGVTEFILNEEPQEVVSIPVKRKSRRKPEKNKDDKVTDAKKGDEKQVDATKPEDKINTESKVAEAIKEDVKTEPTQESQAPVENINIADKSAEKPLGASDEKSAEKPVEEIVAEKPVQEIVTEKPKVKNVEKKSETPIDEVPIVNKPSENSQVGEVKAAESQVDKSLDSLIDNMDSTDKGKKSTMADKIVADDVYTPPPAYDQLGRGLVYNCKDKFWACLDKTAYVACNKNMKWNKSHGKSAECTIQNVYNSDEDCSMVQKYNISTNKATSFCF